MDSNDVLYLARNSPKMMMSSAISKFLSQQVSWNTGLRLLDNYTRVGQKCMCNNLIISLPGFACPRPVSASRITGKSMA